MASDCSPRPVPPPQGEDMDDDDIILGSPRRERPAPSERGVRRRRQASVAWNGIFPAWVVGDASLPQPGGAAGSGSLPGPAAQPVVVGTASMEWRFVQGCDSARETFRSLEPPRRGRASRALDSWGYVEYRFLSSWPLVEYVAVPESCRLDGIDATMRLRTCCNDSALAHSYSDVRKLFAVGPFRVAKTVLVLPWPVAVAAFASDNMVVRSVGLSLRGRLGELVPAFPKQVLVARWKKLLDVQRIAQVAAMEEAEGDPYDNTVCELPKQKQARTTDDADEANDTINAKVVKDPLKLIKALRFMHLLRDAKDFKEGLAAARDYDAEGSDEDVRPEKDDPSTSTLRRAFVPK